MTNAVPGWIEISVERIKTQEWGKHTGARNGNHGTLKIRAAQRVLSSGGIGYVNTLRLQLINESYITRIDIDEW